MLIFKTSFFSRSVSDLSISPFSYKMVTSRLSREVREEFSTDAFRPFKASKRPMLKTYFCSLEPIGRYNINVLSRTVFYSLLYCSLYPFEGLQSSLRRTRRGQQQRWSLGHSMRQGLEHKRRPRCLQTAGLLVYRSRCPHGRVRNRLRSNISQRCKVQGFWAIVT